MTIQERLEKLIEDGCCITVEEGTPILLARAVIQERTNTVRWCGVFPEHQSHVHQTSYDAVEVFHDRDVAFYRDGKFFLYIAPVEEWFVDSEYYNTLQKWRRLMKGKNAAPKFDSFFENAV